MDSLNNIDIKIKYILSYIELHNLSNKILDPMNCKTIYTIKDLLKGFFIFNLCFTSYAAYSFIRKMFKLKIPSKTRINTFSIKISKMRLIEKAYVEYINTHIISNSNDDDKYLLIDSTFIPNKCMNLTNDIIGMNAYYKSKNGCKLTFITDLTGNKCLKMSIDAGNNNDSKIAVNFIQSLDKDSLACLKNKTYLADSGYDTYNFKNELDNLKCKYIIPKNIRNENTLEYKNNKENIINTTKEKKEEY